MSCQRCGGVLAAELVAAMYELVCERAVIESRHCHCADVEDPELTNLSRESVGAPARELPKATSSKEGHDD
jgi:hypothetical protein